MSTINNIVVNTVKAYHRELDSIIDAMLHNDVGYYIQSADTGTKRMKIRALGICDLQDFADDMNTTALDQKWDRFIYTVYGSRRDDGEGYKFVKSEDTGQYYDDMISYFHLADLDPLFKRLIEDRLYDLEEEHIEYNTKKGSVSVNIDVVYSYTVESKYSDSVPKGKLVIDPYNMFLYRTTDEGLVHYYDRESAEDTAQKDNLLVVA